jgi:curved DNA-binding protein CbpA
MRNPYKVLKIPRSASEADIKKSFRGLAKKLHPDANNSDPTATARFAELNAAYEFLSDWDTRTAFDRGKIDSEGRPTRPKIARVIPRRPIVTGLMMVVMLASTSTLVIRALTPRTEINANSDGRKAILPRLEANGEHLSTKQSDTYAASGVIPRALHVSGEAAASDASTATPTTVSAPADRNADQQAAAASADPEQIELLIGRSEKLLSEGDIAAGRALLQRAAKADDARAAFALGATYDPIMLTILGAYSAAADVSLARDWYKKASELGSREAQERLKLLASAPIGRVAVPRSLEPGIAAKDTVNPAASAKPRKRVIGLPSREQVPASDPNNDPNGVYVAGERIGTDPDPNIRVQLLRDDAGRQLHISAPVR